MIPNSKHSPSHTTYPKESHFLMSSQPRDVGFPAFSSWQENATTALAGMMFEVKKPMLCTCNCEMTCFVSLSLRFCLFLSLELCNDEVCHPRHEAIVMRRYECEMGTDIGLVHTLVWPVSRPKYQNLETC